MIKKIEKATMVAIFAMLLAGCSESSIDGTTFIKTIETPVISALYRSVNLFEVEVNQSYTSVQQDLKKVIMLTNGIDKDFDDFDSDENKKMDAIDELPYYASASEDLVLTSNVFDVNFTIGDQWLIEGNSYKVAVATWGSNELYARANEHNGWFFSKVSQSKEVYIAPAKALTLTNLRYFRSSKYNPNEVQGDACYGVDIDVVNNSVQSIEPVCLNQNNAGLPLPANFDERTDSGGTIFFSLWQNEGIKPAIIMPCNAENTGLYPVASLIPLQKGRMVRPKEDDGEYACGQFYFFNQDYSNNFIGKNQNFYSRYFINSLALSSTVQEDEAATVEIEVYVRPGNVEYVF